MTKVVATHAVGNMETWLAGGEERAELFAQFSSSYQIYRHTDRNEVALVWEGVDLGKMQALLASPESAAKKAKHTVIDPISVFIEVEGGK